MTVQHYDDKRLPMAEDDSNTLSTHASMANLGRKDYQLVSRQGLPSTSSSLTLGKSFTLKIR